MTDTSPKRPATRIGVGLTLLAASVIGTLAVVELVLRVLAPGGPVAVWPPHLRLHHPADDGVMPGVEGASLFSTNEWGLRGPPFDEDDDVRILVLGGSTAECLFLDDTEAWPHLMRARLAEAWPDRRIWIGNAGRAGHTARHHVLQAEELPPQYPRIDAAVVLVGLNDLLNRLRRADRWNPWPEEPDGYDLGLEMSAFARRPRGATEEPAFKRTELWKMLRRVRQALEVRRTNALQVDGAEFMTGLRRARAERIATLDAMPDLTAALADYELTLGRLVDTLSAQGIRPILVTQPTIWRDATADEEALLWFGRDGPVSDDGNAFYSPNALADGMAAYNRVLLNVCERRGLACVDLAGSLPRDTTVFYDDAHFNEPGARQVADVISRSLVASDPFR